MSGSVDLTIETGTEWGVQFTWLDQFGDPVPFSDPVMNVRQELTTQSKLIAKLDESGQWDGKLTITDAGVLQARMTSTQTDGLKPGYGFWDIFVTVYGNRTRLVFGTMAVAAHVTELSDD